jgi:ABC-type transport system involved in multi-copper enzyme maturation permease subunit
MLNARHYTSLFRAEWEKIVGHRWAVGRLMWVFPAGALGILTIMLLVALLASPDIQRNFGLASVSESVKWTEIMIGAWNIPNEMFGRLILIAFTAVMFAGEFQWGTWKNLLPRRERVPLILNKFVTLGAFAVVSFGATALIAGVGMFLPVTIAGGQYGPPLADALQSDFPRNLAVQAATTFTATITAAGYAALGAMITRSILGSMMIGMGLMLLEMVSLGVLGLIGSLFGKPEILALFQLTPAYNLSNITSQVNHAANPFPFLLPYAEPNSMGLSLLILAVWVFGMIGLTTYLFKRQDVTT